MRGNGAITVGQDLKEAATFAFFLEDAARVERDVRSMGFGPQHGLLDEDEIRARQTLAGGVVERMWRWLTAMDVTDGRGESGGCSRARCSPETGRESCREREGREV